MSRRGNKWTINELLRLQREYELLELTIQEIAERHKRSVTAILCKLEAEGFIKSWDDARGFVVQDITQSNTIHDNIETEFSEVSVTNDYNETTEIDVLTDRIWTLETSVKEIGSMVKQMFDGMVNKKKNKLKPLRKKSVQFI